MLNKDYCYIYLQYLVRVIKSKLVIEKIKRFNLSLSNRQTSNDAERNNCIVKISSKRSHLVKNTPSESGLLHTLLLRCNFITLASLLQRVGNKQYDWTISFISRGNGVDIAFEASFQ